MPRGKYPRPSLAERFERLSIPEPNTGCHLWLGATRGNGYGSIDLYPHGVASAHRVAYECANGVIPDGMCVMHRCDMRLCVNPDHLRLGTHAENMADMATKGRTNNSATWFPKGDAHPRHFTSTRFKPGWR